MPRWETGHWLYGKGKDSITSQLAMLPIIKSMWLRILIIQMISKDCGHMSTILTV